ncbi:hypothetical protein ACTFIW_004703 [Dictyostelium discoideum]
MDIPKFDFYRFSKIKLEDDQLFFKVWRNVNLKNKYIFYHLRIFNIANKYIKHNFYSLREYPLRNYLTVLVISNDETKTNDEVMGAFIPSGIIPYSNLIISKGDLPDTINSIKFGSRFKECIDNDTLPNNLIILRLGRHTEIGENLILPNSLEYLSIERNSQLSFLKKVKSSIKYLSKIGKSKRFSSLIDFSTHLKQLVYLKVYMAGNVKEGYIFDSLKIVNVNDQQIKIFYYVDPTIIDEN